MNTKIISCALALSWGLFAGCSSNESDGSVTIVEKDGWELTICNVENVKDTLTIPLSTLIEDCKLVRFENSDTSLFKFSGIAISDNYIGIRNSGGAFKLFDHDGKFLCDVGGYGQGPGEYGNLYDELIDETNKCIYLAPFFGSKKIFKYDLNGKYLEGIDFGEELNKPKLGLNPDGTISVTHLCFKETSTFMSAHVAKDGTITQYIPTEDKKINPLNEEGQYVGFSNEIWSYQNVPGLAFMNNIDTLYNYNPKTNNQEARFALNFPGSGEKPFCIFNELPRHFIGIIWGHGTILVDKQSHKSSFINIVNDSYGNIGAPLNFNKGWFFAIYEPGTLIERIDTYFEKGNCSQEDREKLEKLKATLDENDNSVMFIGKLKK